MLPPLSQAWDKGRRLAKSVSLLGPWPGEATVKSKSCDEPRCVDLARCCRWAERGLETSVSICQEARVSCKVAAAPAPMPSVHICLLRHWPRKSPVTWRSVDHHDGSRVFKCSLSSGQGASIPDHSHGLISPGVIGDRLFHVRPVGEWLCSATCTTLRGEGSVELRCDGRDVMTG